MAVFEHSIASRAFGILQGAVFVLIAGTVVFHYRRQKNRDGNNDRRLDPSDIRAAVGRVRASGRPHDLKPSQDQTSSSGPREAPPKLESALPLWTKDTEPHIILGVHQAANLDEIEQAYKSLLKKYHPDRFASWGSGYQNRAHQIILLLQDARERMLKRKS